MIDLRLGDCFEVMQSMADNSIDLVLTDPPYGLKFMGKKWDYDVPPTHVWYECLRVLKPGGHLLAFAGTRTQHRMACRIEDAGFEIRDCIMWHYGSGFPKSYNGTHGGTALKPATEIITMARKQLIGTVAANFAEYGTGGLNIDACRVGTTPEDIAIQRARTGGVMNAEIENDVYQGGWKRQPAGNASGRWPANLIHDGSEEVVGMFPMTGASRAARRGALGKSPFSGIDGSGRDETNEVRGHSDAGGSAARFFYCAKSSKRERNQGLDSTRTVKYDIDRQLIGDLPCLKVATVLVQLLRKATFGSGLRWNIGESGESITGRFQSECLSTIKTKTSEITESKILSLLMPSLISESIADVNCGMASGGSHAESAAQSSLLTQTSTSESLAELARGVRLVVSPMLSQIKDEENWVAMTNFHATVKPIALMEYLVKLASSEGQVVLDPFMGSGTTGIACQNLNRKFIGIEMDQAYFEIAKSRINNAASEVLF